MRVLFCLCRFVRRSILCLPNGEVTGRRTKFEAPKTEAAAYYMIDIRCTLEFTIFMWLNLFLVRSMPEK